MSVDQAPAGSSVKLTESSVLQPRSSPAEPRLRIRVGDSSREFTYEEAFAFGHELMRNRKFAAAASIFERLIRFPQRGPRAHLMLAICRAGMSQYEAAFATLKTAFIGKDHPLAAAIYDVIIQARMGFKDDARRQLLQLVKEHEELPTLCLWLGDMLEASQQVEKAVQCWKLALRRDRRGGGVALAASHQLRRFKQN